MVILKEMQFYQQLMFYMCNNKMIKRMENTQMILIIYYIKKDKENIKAQIR